MAVQRAAVFVSFNRLSKKQGNKDKRTRPRPLLVSQFSLSEELLPVETLQPGCKRRESLALIMQSSNVHKLPMIKINFNGNQLQQQMKTSRCISASFCIYFFIEKKNCENSAGSLKRPLAFACQPSLSAATARLMTLPVTRGEPPLPETQTVRRSPARVA